MKEKTKSDVNESQNNMNEAIDHADLLAKLAQQDEDYDNHLKYILKRRLKVREALWKRSSWCRNVTKL